MPLRKWTSWADQPRRDRPHLQRDGIVWWFCSVACREEFAADPDRFTTSQGPARRAVRDGEPDPLKRHDPTINSAGKTR
jgi:hypothetical protein